MAESKLSIYIDEEKYDYQAAKDWNSLTRSQLLLWCGILRKEMKVDEALLTMALQLYQIPKKIYMKWGVGVDMSLSNQMRWLLDNQMTKNVLGKIRIGPLVYYGPANRLSNITIGEYRRTELYYQMYIKTGSKEYIYLLIATLFRQKGGKATNDMRCELTERGVMNRAKFFKWALHPILLMAVQLFYEGCRTSIIKSHKLVYPVVTEEEKKNNANQLNDLEDTILTYSGGKLGNFEETNKSNVFVFLKHMEQKIEEYQRNKRS